MRILLGDNKKLIVACDYHDVFDGSGSVFATIPTINIAIKNSMYKDDLERKIRQAIAEVIKQEEPLLAELDMKPVFDEKRRQRKLEYDTEDAITEIIETWDCATLTDRSWE